MTSDTWILNSINEEQRRVAHHEAARRTLGAALLEHQEFGLDLDLTFITGALELAVFDILDDPKEPQLLRKLSAEAYEICRVLQPPVEIIERRRWLVRTACLGVLGDRGSDVSKFLKTENSLLAQETSELWGPRVFERILEAWLCLLRKDGWGDLDRVQHLVLELRHEQKEFETNYLEQLQESGSLQRQAALELVVLYHLAKAAELLAIYTTQGMLERGTYDVRQQLEAQFDRALAVCDKAGLIELETLSRLLMRTAMQLVDNSIWTVTRAVNSRVTQFVRSVVHGRRPIFEMLPPQRKVLREEGLLGSAHRSVVVNLPTSSGKTFIAQFRILQALNQFDHEKGWVAYLAPTRALVNQITVRLRRDFEVLSIGVEKVSPALELDGLEEALLTDKNPETQFKVLVTTPEKMDLLIRGKIEEKLDRPLTLIVVDEAHNIAQKERGIKLELLLATINRECQYAQFLLLTPFINNSNEVAKWLAPDSYKNVEVSLEWQPNDRSIVLSKPKPENSERDFALEFETLHTSRNTLVVPEPFSIHAGRSLGLTYKQVSHGNGKLAKLASATANYLKERGPVIVLAQRPDWTWSVARNFKHQSLRKTNLSDEVLLVQRYLAFEFGKDFELIDLLNYGVGVHHSGISDEARSLMEWLFENKRIDILVATTTIAQGVNFPISGVVFAHYTYPEDKKSVEMPAEDFWNIAGRAGRVDQDSVGIIAFASPNDESASHIRDFVKRNVSDLNSTLIQMVNHAIELGRIFDLKSLYWLPEWSSFLQYLVHTFRQMGNADRFVIEIEQILRGTFGFQLLRRTDQKKANDLITGVIQYANSLSGKPLKLVDSTGFSLESILLTLKRLADERVKSDIWNPETLFSAKRDDLKILMGILLQVPELRGNLEAVIGGKVKDGNTLARLTIDWVNGASLTDLANAYFNENDRGKPLNSLSAMTNCCKNVFGRLIQTTSWGISALQSMTIGDKYESMSDTERQTFRNLPARIFYGVNTDEAVCLRMLGVPRTVAPSLAREFKINTATPLSQIRSLIRTENGAAWKKAMANNGKDFYEIWQILEGIR